MTLAYIGVFILGAFAGVFVGIGIMCLVSANGPSADEAIRHLSLLLSLVDDDGVCEFRNWVIADRVLDNARHFLDDCGDEYVTGTRGRS